ncbi:hypothetical protein F5887DRAFT_997797 [Amanita rubescens]|nr:hypothetical protein F5887DRAFT_997797 [Amanita rubescens]
MFLTGREWQLSGALVSIWLFCASRSHLRRLRYAIWRTIHRYIFHRERLYLLGVIRRLRAKTVHVHGRWSSSQRRGRGQHLSG